MKSTHTKVLDSIHYLVQAECYLFSFGPLRNLFLHFGGCLLGALHLLFFLALFAHDCCDAQTDSVTVPGVLSLILNEVGVTWKSKQTRMPNADAFPLTSTSGNKLDVSTVRKCNSALWRLGGSRKTFNLSYGCAPEQGCKYRRCRQCGLSPEQTFMSYLKDNGYFHGWILSTLHKEQTKNSRKCWNLLLSTGNGECFTSL